MRGVAVTRSSPCSQPRTPCPTHAFCTLRSRIVVLLILSSVMLAAAPALLATLETFRSLDRPAVIRHWARTVERETMVRLGDHPSRELLVVSADDSILLALAEAERDGRYPGGE